MNLYVRHLRTDLSTEVARTPQTFADDVESSFYYSPIVRIAES